MWFSPTTMLWSNRSHFWLLTVLILVLRTPWSVWSSINARIAWEKKSQCPLVYPLSIWWWLIITGSWFLIMLKLNEFTSWKTSTVATELVCRMGKKHASLVDLLVDHAGSSSHHVRKTSHQATELLLVDLLVDGSLSTHPSHWQQPHICHGTLRISSM